MATKDSVKRTIESVGTALTILRDGGDVTGEYCDVEPNSQVTKPFVREFFLEASLVFDTEVVPGDVVQFDDGRKLLVMNSTPAQFRNEVITNEAVLYKCNVSGELWRSSGEAWNAD